MTNQKAPKTENNEMRVMWIFSAAILALLLGGMGINMLMTHDTSAGSTETSTQSGTVLPK